MLRAFLYREEKRLLESKCLSRLVRSEKQMVLYGATFKRHQEPLEAMEWRKPVWSFISSRHDTEMFLRIPRNDVGWQRRG